MPTPRLNAADAAKVIADLVKATKPKPPSVAAEIVMHTEKVAESCIDRMREAYAVMKEAYKELHQAIAVVHNKAATNTQPQIVDSIFAAKECKNLAAEMEKEINALMKELQKLVVNRWLTDASAQGEEGERIDGYFAWGYPEIKKRAALPTFAKDPELYNMVMDWLGVPEDLRDSGKILVVEGEFRSKVVELDYIGFNHMLEKYELVGIPIPDFIYKYDSFDEYIVRTRKVEDLM